MIFSLSRHGSKHWLTRLQCDGDKSLLIISYANFITVFWQFSDDSKYLSSYHKEMITARICSLWGDAYVVQIAIVATGFTCRTAADKLRLILSDSQCLRVFNWSFPFFLFMTNDRCNDRIKVGNVLRQVTLQEGHVCATTERGYKKTSFQYICIEFWVKLLVSWYL